MYITDIQFDTLREIINIGVGKSASSLNKIVGKKINLQVPTLEIISIPQLGDKYILKKPERLSVVNMNFKGEIAGSGELVFPAEGANRIIEIVTNESHSEESSLDHIKLNTLNEIGNIILNSLIGTLGNLLKTRIRYSVPRYFECVPSGILDNINNKTGKIVYAETHFQVKDTDIFGSFMLFLEVNSFAHLLNLLDDYVKAQRNA